jgi:hypothetical protein
LRERVGHRGEGTARPLATVAGAGVRQLLSDAVKCGHCLRELIDGGLELVRAYDAARSTSPAFERAEVRA